MHPDELLPNPLLRSTSIAKASAQRPGLPQPGRVPGATINQPGGLISGEHYKKSNPFAYQATFYRHM